MEYNVAGLSNAQRIVGSYILVENVGTYKWAPVVSLTTAAGYLYIGVSIEAVNYAISLSPVTNAMHVLFKPEGNNWVNGTDDYLIFEAYNKAYTDWQAAVTTTGDIAETSGDTIFLHYDWILNNQAYTNNASGGSGGNATVLSAGGTYYNIPAVSVKVIPIMTLQLLYHYLISLATY